MVVVNNCYRRRQLTHQGQSLGRVGQRDGEVFGRFLNQVFQDGNQDGRRDCSLGEGQHTRLGGVVLAHLGRTILNRVGHGGLANQASRTVNHNGHLTDVFADLERELVKAGGTLVIDDHHLNRGPATRVYAHGLAGEFNGERLIAFSQLIIQQADRDCRLAPSLVEGDVAGHGNEVLALVGRAGNRLVLDSHRFLHVTGSDDLQLIAGLTLVVFDPRGPELNPAKRVLLTAEDSGDVVLLEASRLCELATQQDVTIRLDRNGEDRAVGTLTRIKVPI